MPSTAKIDAWLDCNSPYSRFAFLHLRRYRSQLASHGVDIEIHPVFINGINAGSSNQPPWMVPAKAKYGHFDRLRAQKYFGAEDMKVPDPFPMKTLLALRSMAYIKANYEREQFEKAFLELWTAAWDEGVDISKPEALAKVYQRHFSEADVKTILQAGTEQKWKDQLNANTKTALEKGAFGAPWFWVRNGKGEEEPFFGSDRFHFMWAYLDIPHRDFEVLEKSAGASKL